jgi:tetratricopeptide (TPR) repeat protein
MSPPPSRLVVTSLLLAPVLLVGGGVLFRADGGSPATDSALAAPRVLAGTADGTTDPAERIAALEQRVARLPGDWTGWTALGSAYLSEAGHGGDSALLSRADAAFARSLAVRPDGNADALAGQAALAGVRHDVPRARELAEQAVAIDPFDAPARGVLADALMELGEYDDGFEQVQRMLDLRPGVPSYTRASYVLELQGDTDGARAAMERALAIAASPSESEFATFHLAELAFDQGDLETAETHLRAGLERDPESTELLVGLARVLVARSEQAAALDAYRRVIDELPDADHHVEYGEYLESLGRVAEAREQYAAADAATARATADGVIPDVEVALYHADHGRADQALDVAQEQYAGRRSIDVEDAYAWALHAAGRHEEALGHAVAAQRLGTRDALVSYHRGMIEAALGMTNEARVSLHRALDINPHFSPRHAPIARRTLAELGNAG